MRLHFMNRTRELAKLTRALGIPVADRHRAAGDAFATVKLFKMLIDKDLKKNIIHDSCWAVNYCLDK